MFPCMCVVAVSVCEPGKKRWTITGREHDWDKAGEADWSVGSDKKVKMHMGRV